MDGMERGRARVHHVRGGRESAVVAKGKSFEVTREPGSVGLVVLQTPKPPPASA